MTEMKIMKSVQAFSTIATCAIACCFPAAQAQNNVGNFYTGEVKVEVVRSYDGPATLPKPEKIVIQDFVVSPDAVDMDQSSAGRIHTRLFLRRDPDDASAPEALAQQVQASFSKALISDLKKLRIQAQRSTNVSDDPNMAHLVISGEVTAIDEGNKVKRVMIGLGRGGSDVQTHVIVSSVFNRKSTVVLELRIKSVSGKKLGALEPVGGGSIALNAAEGAATDRGSTVQKDATRMAKGVAKQIQKVMVAEQWEPAAAAVADDAEATQSADLVAGVQP